MIKELFQLLQKSSLLEQAVTDTQEMLNVLERMFEKSIEYLHDGEKSNAITEVPELDKKINNLQQKVRRFIYSHLIVSGTTNLYMSLVLTQMGVELERIGDYIKNLVDTRRISGKNITFYQNLDELNELEQKVLELIQDVRQCINKQDEELGGKIQKDYYQYLKICNDRDDEFLNETNSASTQEVAMMVLYYRYMKRIFAHLMNVASGITNPFDRIGFHPKDII